MHGTEVFKKRIIDMIEDANDKQLDLIFRFVRALLFWEGNK